MKSETPNRKINQKKKSQPHLHLRDEGQEDEGQKHKKKKPHSNLLLHPRNKMKYDGQAHGGTGRGGGLSSFFFCASDESPNVFIRAGGESAHTAQITFSVAVGHAQVFFLCIWSLHSAELFEFADRLVESALWWCRSHFLLSEKIWCPHLTPNATSNNRDKQGACSHQNTSLRSPYSATLATVWWLGEAHTSYNKYVNRTAKILRQQTLVGDIRTGKP